MVNLLRFVERSIRDKWFVINKPFGLPTMLNAKISWDLSDQDSVINRLIIMGYENISCDTTTLLKEQQSDLLGSKLEYSTGKIQESTPRKPLKPSQWRSIASEQPLFSFSPLWNMKTDCRGLLTVAQGRSSIEFFRRCVQRKLIRRTYITLVEHTLESQKSAFEKIPERLDGYTIRSDLFWSTDRSKPGPEERIYSLFLDKSNQGPKTHPWISDQKLLTVLPCEKVNGRKGKPFNLRAKLLKQNSVTNKDGSTSVRQMYAVDVLDGTEDALRCVFSHQGHPVTNDVLYNRQFAKKVLREYMGELPREKSSESSEQLHNDIERTMLEKALRPSMSNFFHLGMCCTKVTFPDPNDTSNQQLMHRTFAFGGEKNESELISLGESLKFATLELSIPLEFIAWLEGKNVPSSAAKNGIQPLANVRSLAVKLVDKAFLHKDSACDEDEELVMVGKNGNSSLVTNDTMKKKTLKYPLIECTESVEIVKNGANVRSGSSFDRIAVLCSNCGDFHSESNCSLVPIKPLSTLEKYEAFYTHVSMNTPKSPFCITCGVFGHQFYGCVHSYSKFRSKPSDMHKKTKDGEEKQFVHKYRQCQLCQSLTHREISCPHRKSPPWGYDDLGSPLRKNFTRKELKPRRQYA